MSKPTIQPAKLTYPGGTVNYFSLAQLEQNGLGDFSRFPFSIRILLESIVRMQGHPAYSHEHIQSLCRWTPTAAREELPYMPARVLLQDFTGVPCVVDLAALRSAMKQAGKNPSLIEPMIPVDLVIDHSVQLDAAGSTCAFKQNVDREFERNTERYRFLKWGQQAFEKLRVLPPGLGICHQINMEYLAGCVLVRDGVAFPDTLVGTDSHTTTINCMGVLGWGVGGIEAEAAMLGQPIPMLTPEVIGFKFNGRLQPGVTSTDLALTVTRMLRDKGVVNKFIEFYGEGAAALSLADRCPVANMAPEYGATMGFFPVDEKTIDYLRETGRTKEHCTLVEAYCKEQGLWRQEQTVADYNDTLELDLSSVEPTIAGPRKPHEQLTLSQLKKEFKQEVPTPNTGVDVPGFGTLKDGAVIIASITSCTNTSNPSLLLGAGLVARKAMEKGMKVPAFVKTSLAPGSQVATRYLRDAGLIQPLESLGFNVAAYGCATCIGNSGPCAEAIDQAIKQNNLTVAAVLSGNRNFEGRVYPLTKLNYLVSPPLVVAYALAGTVNIDLDVDPIGQDRDGHDVYLRDLWYTKEELAAVAGIAANSDYYREVYADIFTANPQWNELPVAEGDCFAWDTESTYIQNPPFFDGLSTETPVIQPIENASALAVFGDFITTDHISPAGNIPTDGPGGKYLLAHGVKKADFNSFGSRRGNHEAMMRGTFANIRIRNRMVNREGGYTRHLPDGEEMPIYDAAMRYQTEGIPLVVLAGKMYGAGSSRDWAAKGTVLLGVKAVIAESFERIHRSNLVEMGVLPLEFIHGESSEALGLTGVESYTIEGVHDRIQPASTLTVRAQSPEGEKTFRVKCRIDTQIEVEYYRHGGILQYVLRQVMNQKTS
ncbi:MAG: aconitate hydratase AcnA [Kiritimatiellae bacterium]|nr:aconitate hydratase AcnA [Kiritimatiellia bacterium]